ncbi:hypothetical protein QQF64_022071 [Cirrhinus molitorella]|uniref:Uncharacterized protein n=1 Tax=Cirrhinus molitorella TaxID=172907 RepID=A0ABR3L7B6_9TELE
MCGIQMLTCVRDEWVFSSMTGGLRGPCDPPAGHSSGQQQQQAVQQDEAAGQGRSLREGSHGGPRDADQYCWGRSIGRWASATEICSENERMIERA